MDMILKPNVMEDIARDVSACHNIIFLRVYLSNIQQSIPPPPPSLKFYSQSDRVMLEDESGRICLVGELIKKTRLVTGVVIGALGFETSNGDFEVVDISYAGMAQQPRVQVGPGKMQVQSASLSLSIPS